MDYRLEVLPEKLDVLVADQEILKPNQITAEEIERVRSLVPRINAMIEAYLAGWTSFAPLETLRRALLPGEALGVLQKALNYRHLLRCLEPNERWMVDYTGAAVKDFLTKVEALQEK